MATREGQLGLGVSVAKGMIKGGISSIPLGTGGLAITAATKLFAVGSSELFEMGAKTALGLEVQTESWTDMASDWIVDASVSTTLSTVGPFSAIQKTDSLGFDAIMDSAPNKILGSVIKPKIQDFAKFTLSNASEYDPWQHDYYMLQPMSCVSDWNSIESRRTG